MFQVEKDNIISEVLMNAPETMPLFQRIGMHCFGCALSTGETVEEACEVHGVDPDEFIEQLNAFIVENA